MGLFHCSRAAVLTRPSFRQQRWLLVRGVGRRELTSGSVKAGRAVSHSGARSQKTGLPTWRKPSLAPLPGVKSVFRDGCRSTGNVLKFVSVGPADNPFVWKAGQHRGWLPRGPKSVGRLCHAGICRSAWVGQGGMKAKKPSGAPLCKVIRYSLRPDLAEKGKA